MTAIIKRPGEDPEIIEVGNGLEDLRKVIGGPIEHVGIGHGIGILCDEDGRSKGPVIDGRPTSLPVNFFMASYGAMVGPVLFVGDSGDDFTGLTEEQQLLIYEMFR